jgi:hypothetical protein
MDHGSSPDDRHSESQPEPGFGSESSGQSDNTAPRSEPPPSPLKTKRQYTRKTQPPPPRRPQEPAPAPSRNGQLQEAASTQPASQANPDIRADGRDETTAAAIGGKSDDSFGREAHHHKPGIDLPGFEDLPADVRARIASCYVDPTSPEPAKIPQQVHAIRVGAPSRDDVIRTYHDETIGWLSVRTVVVKKGMGQSVNKKVYLVGPKAIENPAVAQRVRVGRAVLTVNSEGVAAVWMVYPPDAVNYEHQYPYDLAKWEAAQRAKTDWVNIYWEADKGHKWSVVDLQGQPNERPVWPSESPLILIDRATKDLLVNDPDHPDFKSLIVKSGSAK